MGRIRTIKPEAPQSESLGRVSREARLTFVYMWTVADDEGRLRGSSRLLASLLFPYDDDAPAMMDGWLEALESEDCIVRYDVGGTRYIQIAKWLEHQKIDKPSKSRIPSFDEASRALAKGREASATDLGPRTLDHGPRTKDTEAIASDATASPPAPIVIVPATEPTSDPIPVPTYTDSKHELWGEGIPILTSLGVSQEKARTMIGRWMRDAKDDAQMVLGIIQRARDQRAIDPIPWITRGLKTGAANQRGGNGTSSNSVFSAFQELRRELDGESESVGGDRGATITRLRPGCAARFERGGDTGPIIDLQAVPPSNGTEG